MINWKNNVVPHTQKIIVKKMKYRDKDKRRMTWDDKR